MERWPKDLSSQKVAEWINGRFSEETLVKCLKMRVVEVGADRALVKLPVHPGLYTPHHYIHAGVMISLAYTAATLAAMAAYRGDLEPEQFPLAVSISSPDCRQHPERSAFGRSHGPTSGAHADGRLHPRNRRRRPAAGLGQLHSFCPPSRGVRAVYVLDLPLFGGHCYDRFASGTNDPGYPTDTLSMLSAPPTFTASPVALAVGPDSPR